MPALLEECGGMSTYEHHALILTGQDGSFLHLGLREALPLPLLAQGFESLGSVGPKPMACRAP